MIDSPLKKDADAGGLGLQIGPSWYGEEPREQLNMQDVILRSSV